MADWWLTKDGDASCLALYERHYSARQYRDGRKRVLFAGPGEKVVLRTAAGDAFFVWRRFVDDCIDIRTGERQAGINCAVFRNESPLLSSDLIRQACAVAAHCWPDRRYYTYVDPEAVRSGLPGWCFIAAGWRYVRHKGHRARTNSGKLILEYLREAKETMEERCPMKLSTEQRGYLTHMLGAESHIAKRNWGYRNYYCAEVGGKDERDLMALAELGLVKRGRTINEGTSVYYFATEDGMDAIGLTPEQKQNASEM